MKDLRNMTTWGDTWGRIHWTEECKGYVTYEAHSDSEIIQIIKNYYHAGVDFNMTDAESGFVTPLHYVARFRSLRVAEALIDGGADMSVPDKKGRTPLHYAALVGDGKMVRYFVEHGPKNYEKVKDRDGKTAAQYAALNGHERIFRFLNDPSNPKAAKECGKVEWIEKKKLIILSILAVLAIGVSGSVVAKQIEKAEKKEKSKVELKAENTQKDVKQKAVEDKKPEPVIVRPPVTINPEITRRMEVNPSEGISLNRDRIHVYNYKQSRER